MLALFSELLIVGSTKVRLMDLHSFPSLNFLKMECMVCVVSGKVLRPTDRFRSCDMTVFVPGLHASGGNERHLPQHVCASPLCFSTNGGKLFYEIVT